MGMGTDEIKVGAVIDNRRVVGGHGATGIRTAQIWVVDGDEHGLSDGTTGSWIYRLTLGKQHDDIDRPL